MDKTKDIEVLKKIMEIDYPMQRFLSKMPIGDFSKTKELYNGFSIAIEQEDNYLDCLNITEDNKETLLLRYKYIVWKSDCSKHVQELLLIRFYNIIQEKLYGNPFWDNTEGKDFPTRKNGAVIRYQFSNDAMDSKIKMMLDDLSMEKDYDKRSQLITYLREEAFCNRCKTNYILFGEEPKYKGFDKCLSFNQNQEFIMQYYRSESNNLIAIGTDNCLAITDKSLKENFFAMQAYLSNKYDVKAAFTLMNKFDFDGALWNFKDIIYNSPEGANFRSNCSFAVNDLMVTYNLENSRIRTKERENSVIKTLNKKN